MISKQRFLGVMVVLTLTFALVLGPGFTRTVHAASEDVAMFYDDLAQYGDWVEYEKYGPVWRPNKVAEDWRPYSDGRWVPTDDGNVFESEEPWGWATYHYGNWMPTENNGWVWVPGRTWYPSTVEWRTSPESEPADTSYVGWAPTPPPNYEPPAAYAPADYYQGSPGVDSLSSGLWIFARAAQFLLGFGQPYTPAYSYMNSGILVPVAYVPVFYSQTVFIRSYATPTYYPAAFFGGRRLGPGYYNMGPSAAYISRVTRINQTVINQTIVRNSTNISRIHSVVPPRGVMDRHRYIRQIMPPALAQGHRLPPPNRVKNFRMAQANLNKPNLVPAPRNVPRVTATIPRVQPGAVPPGRVGRVTALPSKAVMPLSPQMSQQIQKLPPPRQPEPGKGVRPGPGQVVAPAHPGPVHPGTPTKAVQPVTPGKFGPGQATVPGQPGQVQPGAHAVPGQVQPGTQTKPGQVQPAVTPPGKAKPGEFHPGTRPSGVIPGRTPATPAVPGAAKPSGVPLPPGHKGLTPEQRRQQEIEHQKLQHGGAAGQTQPQQQQQKQQQLQQEQQKRQQQIQQQQRQQEQQKRQQQLQQQQRQQQIQQEQQKRQQQIQQQQQQQRQQQLQQQQRQQQLQQQQRQQQLQQQQRQQQLQQQRQPQVQPKPQPKAQPQPQKKKDEHQ
jgi:hypothetical protein